eukprot:3238244-Alexandrium_andersonii.AAC.1
MLNVDGPLKRSLGVSKPGRNHPRSVLADRLNRPADLEISNGRVQCVDLPISVQGGGERVLKSPRLLPAIGGSGRPKGRPTSALGGG